MNNNLIHQVNQLFEDLNLLLDDILEAKIEVLCPNLNGIAIQNFVPTSFKSANSCSLPFENAFEANAIRPSLFKILSIFANKSSSTFTSVKIITSMFFHF